ncbi:hypothetical protein BV898_14989 [Hypsibius exemplaris]|uniref:Phytanoyl-CoA dioxygenase n=1 Tax=Hypsibius exemplaris TaxID=2072580 RepID=A0A9X6N9L8_HYPEX|nr:hypothetical protein BV898_14989 [Hypsibius exemplaris]
MSSQSTVTPEDVATFWEDGAVCLRKVFPPDWIAKMTAGIETSLLHPSPIAKNPSPGFFYDYINWKNIPQFQDFVFHSPAADIVKTLLKTRVVTFYFEHVLVKEPGTLSETPWHQDQSYYPFNGEQACSIWMPVDPVSKETTLRLVKGSHKWDAEALDYKEIPDISHLPSCAILEWQLEPGDCIVFHMKTIHGAYGNSTEERRRVLSTRWFGDDVTFSKKPWEHSPPFFGNLVTGNHPSLAKDLFPVVIS